MDEHETLLTAALDYCARGWSVIPLCWPGHPAGLHRGYACVEGKGGKLPLVPWKRAQDTRAAPLHIVGWWEEWHMANVGVVMGSVSGIVAWDIDDHEGWVALLTMMGGRLDMNWKFSTGGGGSRLLYAWPDGAPPTPRHFSTGSHSLSFLGEGSYTVMPPSRHRSGNRYAWDKGMDPASMPLLIAPPNMVEALTKPKEGDRKRRGEAPAEDLASHGHEYQRNLARAYGYARRFSPAIQGQGGRRVAFTLACALVHGFGLTEEDALGVMMGDWNSRCEPEWPCWELRLKVQSAADKGHFNKIDHKPLPEER